MEKKINKKITRRQFLQSAVTSFIAITLSEPLFASLKYIFEINTPLDFYPDRDW